MKITGYKNNNTTLNFKSNPPTRKIAREIYKSLDASLLEYAKKEGITKSAILDILQNENPNKIQDTNAIQKTSSILLQKLKDLVSAINNNTDTRTLKKRFKLTKLTTKHLYNQLSKIKRNNDIIEMYKESKDKEKIAKEFNVCRGTVDLITRKGNAFKELIMERDKIIEKMLNENIPSKQIATELGLTQCMIQRTARKLGKPLKHGGQRAKRTN